MTSPIVPVDVLCPSCGHTYEAYYRASFNMSIEPWTEEDIEKASVATCPACGFKVYFDNLIVQPDGTWVFHVGAEEEDEEEGKNNGPC